MKENIIARRIAINVCMVFLYFLFTSNFEYSIFRMVRWKDLSANDFTFTSGVLGPSVPRHFNQIDSASILFITFLYIAVFYSSGGMQSSKCFAFLSRLARAQSGREVEFQQNWLNLNQREWKKDWENSIFINLKPEWKMKEENKNIPE